jgi:hypothetical protein
MFRLQQAIFTGSKFYIYSTSISSYINTCWWCPDQLGINNLCCVDVWGAYEWTNWCPAYVELWPLWRWLVEAETYVGVIDLTNSMEQSPSWEASRSPASQEIPRVLWNPKVHYRTHKSPPPVPILSQRISPGPRLCIVFRNMEIFLRWGVVSTSPNPQAGGPPPVGCPRLHIRSYPPYLEAVPPSATRGRAVPWWQGPTNHGGVIDLLVRIQCICWSLNFTFIIIIIIIIISVPGIVSKFGK